jgi:hypothetical protein
MTVKEIWWKNRLPYDVGYWLSLRGTVLNAYTAKRDDSGRLKLIWGSEPSVQERFVEDLEEDPDVLWCGPVPFAD